MALMCRMWACAIASTLVFAWAAPAATRSATFQVTATVEASCHMRTTPSAHANISPIPVRATDRLQVSCSPSAPHALSVERSAASVRADRQADRVLVLVTF